MPQDLLDALSKTASSLDAKGQEQFANKVDELIKRLASYDYVLDQEDWQMPEYEEKTPEEEDQELQQVTEEDEQYNPTPTLMREIINEGSEWYEDALLENDIVPMRLHGDSELGSGAWGTVVRGLYHGKQVAVKVMSARETDDIANWQKLQSIRDGLSPEAQKHMPEIYEVIIGNRYAVIVMELLKPVTQYVLKVLFDYGNNFKPLMNVKNVLKDEGKIYNAVSEAVHNENIPNRSGFSSTLFKNMLEMHLPEEVSDSNRWDEALDDLSIAIGRAVRDTALVHNIDPREDSMRNIYNIISKYMRKLVKPDIPSSAHEFINYPQDYPWMQDSPEIASFVNALMELGQAGLYWDDVHSGNVMMRPSTDELVIIDVDFYDQEAPTL